MGLPPLKALSRKDQNAGSITLRSSLEDVARLGRMNQRLPSAFQTIANAAISSTHMVTRASTPG
jgi:hypothetical protein